VRLELADLVEQLGEVVGVERQVAVGDDLAALLGDETRGQQ
jgi:hypothetical protein